MKYSPDSEVILEVTDYFGTLVRFSKRNYDRHKEKHPELRQKQFCPGQIAMAIENPTLTIQGNQPGTIRHYLELFRAHGIIKYTKVVVDESLRLSPTNPYCVIKTAFKTDHVQELKYGFSPTYYSSRGV